MEVLNKRLSGFLNECCLLFNPNPKRAYRGYKA